METNPSLNTRNEMSVGDWMITILITALPLIGLIMLFVWAFSESTPRSKATWAKATLIWYAIAIALSVIFVGVAGLAAFGLSNS